MSKEKGEFFPPFQVDLRFCSVCGATDRYRNLKLGDYHFGRDGKRCPGTVETIRYVIAEAADGRSAAPTVSAAQRGPKALGPQPNRPASSGAALPAKAKER